MRHVSDLLEKKGDEIFVKFICEKFSISYLEKASAKEILLPKQSIKCSDQLTFSGEAYRYIKISVTQMKLLITYQPLF